MKYRELFVPLLAGLMLAPTVAWAQEVAVTGISMMPSANGPRMTIDLSGPTTFTDFTLENPARLVVDVQNATQGLPRNLYPVERGGVESVRSSQFAPGIVRVVIDLVAPTPYTVGSGPEGIVIELRNEQIVFEPFATEAGAVAQQAPEPPVPAAIPVQAPPAVPTSTQPRITVTFQDANILDVLASFAEFTGRSIVPGSGVSGQVTATITDQPWDVALETILRAYGLAAQELPSGIIQVDAIGNLQERQTIEPLVTQTFQINYVPVDELAASLAPLSSERGRISTSTSTNMLIVTDVAPVLDRMAGIVGELDVRTPQVSIEAKIIFVNRTDVEELGVTYDLKDSQGSSLNEVVAVPDPFNPGEVTNSDLISLGGNSIAALGNANIRVQQPQLETVLSLVLGRHTLITFIDALQSQELSDVQAAPLITTLDNQTAEIWVGERTPIRVVDVGTPVAATQAASAPRATAELVETGIRLRVTPHITADRRILMQLHAERSSAQLAATDIGVVFQQQQGDTRLMVEDGETAVIGGLTVTEVASTTAGIPYLMDLPVIGPLFRTTREREQKRDLLIMVTPHIVGDQS